MRGRIALRKHSRAKHGRAFSCFVRQLPDFGSACASLLLFWNLTIENCLGFGNWNLELRRIIRGQVRFVLLLMFSAQAFGAGLGSYSDLVVSDSPATRHNGVRGTYLGTNGY